MAVISRSSLNTLYTLQHVAALQPGSIGPVIKDLEKAGLLDRKEIAKRGRRRRTMALTQKGKALLAAEWKNCLAPNREMESVLRGLTVALLMDDFGAALSFLDQCASERERYLEVGKMRAGPGARTPIEFHAQTRAIYGNRRRAMEADLLRGFATDLQEAGPRVTGSQTWNSSGSRHMSASADAV